MLNKRSFAAFLTIVSACSMVYGNWLLLNSDAYVNEPSWLIVLIVSLVTIVADCMLAIALIIMVGVAIVKIWERLPD